VALTNRSYPVLMRNARSYGDADGSRDMQTKHAAAFRPATETTRPAAMRRLMPRLGLGVGIVDYVHLSSAARFPRWQSLAAARANASTSKNNDRLRDGITRHRSHCRASAGLSADASGNACEPCRSNRNAHERDGSIHEDERLTDSTSSVNCGCRVAPADNCRCGSSDLAQCCGKKRGPSRSLHEGRGAGCCARVAARGISQGGDARALGKDHRWNGGGPIYRFGMRDSGFEFQSFRSRESHWEQCVSIGIGECRSVHCVGEVWEQRDHLGGRYWVVGTRCEPLPRHGCRCLFEPVNVIKPPRAPRPAPPPGCWSDNCSRQACLGCCDEATSNCMFMGLFICAGTVFGFWACYEGWSVGCFAAQAACHVACNLCPRP